MKASQKPKISVVMAVHNGMPYLKAAVKSILSQTYKDFEFIIIDDASSDKSWIFLKSLKDKRIKLLKNWKNLGLASSLNKGLKIASGQYIARMDADDISLPKRFEKQELFLRVNPQIDICGTWATLIDDNDKTLGLVERPTDDKTIKKTNVWTPGLIHPTWFVRRDVFKKLDGYNPKYDMVEDLEFLNRAKIFKMGNISDPLLLWRSTQNRRSQKDIQQMYKKSLAFRLEHFLKGDFGLLYFPLIVRSIIATYLFPPKFKIYLNKKSSLP